MIKSMRHGFIYFFEPKSIADYNPEMMNIAKGHQSYSGKTYDIKFAHGIFKATELIIDDLEYLSNICQRSPSLQVEIDDILLEKYKICLI